MTIFRQRWTSSCSVATVLFVLGAGAGQLPGIARTAKPSARPRVVAERVAPSASRAEPIIPIRPERVPAVRATLAPASSGARLDLFRGLGAWVDLYDFGLDPRATIQTLKTYGVRTLYVQTGRSNTAYGIDPRVRPWLVYGHRAGLKVVGWYLPYYKNVTRDVRRTAAIARARFGSDRFDGLGIDIEFRSARTSSSVWNRRVVALGTLVRRAVGPNYPVAAIPPPPLQMRVAPGRWAGFPWRGIAASADTIMLMSYWSARTGCPEIKRFCAYDFTRINVALTRKLIARPGVLVHVIGGVGSRISAADLVDFVRGARDAQADGASIYDVHTTPNGFWPTLSQLRTLGG